jgi:hypothetical protein
MFGHLFDPENGGDMLLDFNFKTNKLMCIAVGHVSRHKTGTAFSESKQSCKTTVPIGIMAVLSHYTFITMTILLCTKIRTAEL